MRTWGTYSVWRAVLVALVALASLAGGGVASADVPAPGDFSPAVWSDKADYSPGEHVIVSGANWQPGEAVHITVNDDVGSTWSHTADVTADAVGAVTDEFDLPSWFVAVYTVHAQGASGATATYSFTDSNVKFTVAPSGATTSVTSTTYANNASCNTSGTPGTVTAGPSFSNASSGTVGGVNSSDSAKLVAAATDDQGGTFKNWTGDGISTPVTSTTLCVPGASGSVNVVANYNAPATNAAPAVAATNSTVTVNEGTAASNSGTWSDANAGDAVTLSASVGTITKSGTNASGSWNWSYTPVDGPLNSQTVTITANDGTTITQTTFALTVNNVMPAVTAPASQSANEGTSTSFAIGSFADPGSDSPWSVDIDWGDGSTHTTFTQNSTGSLGSLNHTYADGPATQTVTVKVTDKDGANQSKTFSVTVNNVGPTVTLSAANDLSIPEGQTRTYNYAISDPGVDTVASVTTSCGANGTKVAGSDTNTNTTGSFQCTFPDGPAASDVSASATDSDGAAGSSATQTVQVTNVAPSVTVTGASTVDEGSTHTYTFTVSDPGQDTFTVDSGYPDCDAGTTNNGTLVAGSLSLTATGGTFQCTFADGPSTASVKVKVSDSDGATDSSTQNVDVVTVSNLAPVVTAPADQTANEGTSTSFDLGSFTDQGPDAPWSVDVDWGDGSTHTTFTKSATGSLGNASHTYADGPATETVTVQVTDKDGGVDSKTFKVTVANVAPTTTLDANDDQTVNEGSTHTYSYTVSDPGDDTATVATSCGANGTKSNETAGSFDCTFPDGDATSVVSATATDSDGGTGNLATQAVTVQNVAPSVTAATDQTADEGSSASIALGSFTDPGADANWSVDVDWGDGSAHTTFDATTTASLGNRSHTYADGPATQTVTVQVTDKDGASNSKTFKVDVKNAAPTVTLSAGNDTTVNEGSTHTYSYTVSDPGDDTATVATSCGANGTKSNPTATSFDCTFPDGPASSDVTVTATDSDGAIGNTAKQTVTVNNVAPTVVVSGAATVDEGTTHTYTFTVSDPGDDTFDAAAGYPTCDTGTLVSGSYSADATGGSFECFFADGPSTANVKMRVTDSDGASDSGTQNVQVVAVANVAPTVTAPSNQTADEGSSTGIDLGSFTDPGTDANWSVDVDWGDGSAHTTFDAATTGSLGNKSHSYADGPATETVTVKVTDKDGASNTKTFDVTVNNVAPTATLDAGNTTSVNEGSQYTYAYTVSDPGADTIDQVNTSCGANGTKSNETATSFDCTFPDGPASSDVTVSATDSDGDTGNTAKQTVTIANLAPTVVLTGSNSADEGQTKAYSFSVTDPGTLDTFSVASGYPDCDAGTTNNGTLVANSLQVTSTGGTFQCFFPDGPSSANVKMKVVDSNGAGDTDSQNVQIVSVANVTPTVTAPVDQTANEGVSTSISLGSFADPGSDANWSVDVDWGDGSAHTTLTKSAAGPLGNASHTYADGPASETVTVKVTDKDGASDSKTFNVDVKNVAPTATIGNDGSINEGANSTISFTSPSDVAPDAAAGFHYAFRCDGTAFPSDPTYTGTGGTSSTSCTFLDSGTQTVRARIIDKDDGWREYTTAVTVNNVAPTVTAPSSQSSNEGASASYDLGSFSDPSPHDGPWAVDVAWGDGSTHTTFNAPSRGALDPGSHTYADNGAYTVTVTVTDKDGGSSNNTFTVNVANVKPTITSFTGTDYLTGVNAYITGGSPLSRLTTVFTDPGSNDQWTAAFTYPDGAPLTPTLGPTFASGQQTTHTFSTAGCKSVSVAVSDKDGGSDTATTTIHVGTGAFQPPMSNAKVTDKLKNGQVLPVKVHITDCSGAGATTLTPAIRLVAGDTTPQNDDSTAQITPTSVSAADTTGVMRSQGGGDYLYNMAVSLPKLNTDYTVVIYPYGTSSPVQLGHVIQATK